MLIEWTKTALKDYEFWKTNKKILSKINKLLESIENSHDKGEGSPERLKHYKGREVWSRHIDKQHRIVYEIKETENEIKIVILTARGHYNDK